MPKTKKRTLKQVLPYILLIAGAIGVFCAGMLTYEKIEILKHPANQLGCDINPIVACGPVINTKQAAAFGFPNPFLGLVGFAVVATIGAAMLAGATFKRWFWLGLQAGVVFGIGFVTWLQFESMYRIHALCPYCMVVWTVMVPLFWYVTLYNLREKNIPVAKKYQGFVDFLQRHHGDILVLYYLSLIAVILHHFWYYWSTVI